MKRQSGESNQENAASCNHSRREHSTPGGNALTSEKALGRTTTGRRCRDEEILRAIPTLHLKMWDALTHEALYSGL
jgi:hypothetical protein